MNIIDIIIVLCFIPALIHGLTKGFITQATALLSVVIGTWLSFKFSAPAGALLQTFIPASGAVLQIVAFVIILVIAILLLNLVGKILTKVVRIVLLGWLDRLLGIAFAAIKALLLVGIAVILFDTLNSLFQFVSPETIESSVLFAPVKTCANTVFPYLKEIIFTK